MTRSLHKYVSAAGPLLMLVFWCASVTAAPWVTFTEINYHPERELLEFIEIYNLEAPHVDLGGWRIEGEVSFTFPKGLKLAPRQCLVIAQNPSIFKHKHPDISNVAGPFKGRLNNDGGRLILRNKIGAIAAEMRYGRDGAWSSVPDGTGHTLVLADAFFDARDPGNWIPSTRPGGSPGVFERTFQRIAGKPLVKAGETWKFLRGKKAVPENWFAPGLDDAAWETGKSGFGFGDDDDATVLDDMRNNYVSVFTRKTFQVADPSKIAALTLLVDYDDGFVAYLNGKEVARSNAGPAGEVPAWDKPATFSREAGRAEKFSLDNPTKALRKGDNLLAVAAFNYGADSSDLSLIAELEYQPVQEKKEEDAAPDSPRLNEVVLRFENRQRFVEWIEFYNPHGKSVDLGGFCLTDDPALLAKWKIPAGTTVAPGGFTALSGKALGIEGIENIEGRVLYLASPEGKHVLDALSTRVMFGKPRKEAVVKLSFGRHPDGGGTCRLLAEPTPRAANRLTLDLGIVINEISYHPASNDPADEWVELHNKSPKTLSLTGLRLRNGLLYYFDVPESIPAGGFAVVAKDPKACAKKHGLDPTWVFGPFKGSLSNDSDEIWLCDGMGRTVDLVSYADKAPWPELADGWGPTLELVDTRMDNALPRAWAASQESHKASWQDIAYTSNCYLFPDMPATSFQFLLLDAGECLMDDLKIVDKDGKTILEEDFNSGKVEWQTFGTHLDSGIVSESPYSRSPCYRLTATGRGNTRYNYVSLGLDPALTKNAKYTVSFRARWLRGCPLLLSRTSGQGLAKMHRLKRLEVFGTPGRPNSRAADAAPIVGTPRQDPIAPSSGQSVRFQVPISCQGGLSKAELHYRHESKEVWHKIALQKMETGAWHCTVPPLPNGRVEFAVVAHDPAGRQGAFPPEGVKRPALYAVGLKAEPDMPTYTLIASDDAWAFLRRRQPLSNYPVKATLVYDTSRIFYNVRFRRRGSGFTRSGNRNWRVMLGAQTLDGRSALTFDGQQGMMGSSKVTERMAYWLYDQAGVPTPRQRYVHVNFLGQRSESGMFEEVEKINGDYLARWFPEVKDMEAKDADGNNAEEKTAENNTGLLHKVDDYWDFRPPSETAEDGGGFPGFGGGRRGPGGGRNGNYIEAYLEYITSDPEDYRWNFPPRANGNSEDFKPLVALIKLADPKQTKDDAFCEQVESMIDVDQWLRILAARTLASDWDAYGLSRGKNAYLYYDATGRWQLLPWDSDLSWRGGFGGGRFGGGRGGSSLFPDKFPAVKRFLAQPAYRRLYLGHVAYLAEKRLDPAVIGQAIREVEALTGQSGRQVLDGASSNRERFLNEIPKAEFKVEIIQRIKTKDQPDRLRLTGTGPVMVHSLRLDGHAGTCQFPDPKTWTATFQIAPKAGECLIEALDRDGGKVASAKVVIPGD